MTLEHKRFPRSEYEARWARAAELMHEGGFDALLVTEPTNFTYYTGGHGDFSFSRPTFLFLPRDGEPVVLVHDFFAPSQARESWVEEIRTYRSLTDFPVHAIERIVGDLGLSSGRIGAELGREQRLGCSYNDFILLTRQLPAVDFADAAELLWAMRMVKSELEVACMEEACRISGQALTDAFERIVPGMTEAEATRLVRDLTTQAGGASAWVVANSGWFNYESGFLTVPSENSLTRGELLWLDTGCKYNGYSSDFSRMASIGPPSSRQQRTFDAVNAVTEAIVQAIRPGMKASDLSRLCNAEFKKTELEDLWGEGDCSTDHSNRAGRIGHGIGLATTEPPHIALYDDTVLRPGMTITIEPTVVTGSGHFNIESNLLVTDSGCRELSAAPRRLYTIED